MKALVLCGGVPQIALLKKLKERGIETVLADMNEKCAAREYADIFYPTSTLDVDGVREVAKKEEVDFLITVCADQVLQVVAEVSEDLGLPCYIDFNTAVNVSKKSYMKKIFSECGVPSSAHLVMDTLDEGAIASLRYPIIVKPVDSYSSRGVRKVFSIEELRVAFDEAVKISRTKTAIIEEFVEGDEITVDVYVEEGVAKILTMSKSEKISGNDKFVIYRTLNPAILPEKIENEIRITAEKIAMGFGLKNSPMLIQLITDGERISVIEFCARTGGGIKFRLIKKVSGFDVIDAVIDLTLGNKPHFDEASVPPRKYIINEFIYCNEGVVDRLYGFDELTGEGVISEYYQLKATGTAVGNVSSSGDRVACFTVEADTIDELKKRHARACATVHIFDKDGRDLIRRELFTLKL